RRRRPWANRRIRRMSDPYETIEVASADGVAMISLNRPDSLNALNTAMRKELLAALKAASRDEAIRAVVLTGTGRGFCSGADLRGGADERPFRAVLTAEYNPLISAIRELPKPVIAAVNGVVPPGELPSHVSGNAQRLAQGPTRAIGLTKRLSNQADGPGFAESLSLEAALQQLGGRTQDHAEGIAAFSEKREPRFAGR